MEREFSFLFCLEDIWIYLFIEANKSVDKERLKIKGERGFLAEPGKRKFYVVANLQDSVPSSPASCRSHVGVILSNTE